MAKPTVKADPIKFALDQALKREKSLETAIYNLEAKLKATTRERNNLSLNCTAFRIRLERANAAIRVLSTVIEQQNGSEIDALSRRAIHEADDLIPF